MGLARFRSSVIKRLVGAIHWQGAHGCERSNGGWHHSLPATHGSVRMAEVRLEHAIILAPQHRQEEDPAALRALVAVGIVQHMPCLQRPKLRLRAPPADCVVVIV